MEFPDPYNPIIIPRENVISVVSTYPQLPKFEYLYLCRPTPPKCLRIVGKVAMVEGSDANVIRWDSGPGLMQLIQFKEEEVRTKTFTNGPK